ncbi:MAG: ATP-binding protein [Candidatus Cloacimonetes bacterium]|nr:ATP-binding protein [Candidatus Cloacimonadota bacterium]
MIKVEHKYYGSGIVRKQRYGGFEFYTEFANGIMRWIRRDEVTLLTEPQLLPKHKLHVSKIPQDQFRARKAIEALRLGIVPHDSLENFTIGRDKEIKALTKWFENDKKGSLFIRGEYGSGKSHLLEYTQIWALKNDWATATVEIGLEENPFFKPYQIYREIVKNFRCNFEGKVLGFRDVLRYLRLHDPEIFDTHLYFKEFLAQFTQFEQRNQDTTNKRKAITEEKIWEWIEGEHNWFKPSLSQVGTAANLYSYVINALSWAVANLLNLKGLVILFDEAEHIDEATYKYQSETGASFLNGIIALAENQETLLKEKISTDKKRGYKTGLIYCGFPRNNPLRYAWKYPSNLKVIFAMTPVQEHTNMIDLQMLRNDDLLTITYNVAQFYKIAYGFEVSDEVVNRLFKKLPRLRTRLFIKYCVEALDILRFNPQISFEDILK